MNFKKIISASLAILMSGISIQLDGNVFLKQVYVSAAEDTWNTDYSISIKEMSFNAKAVLYLDDNLFMTVSDHKRGVIDSNGNIIIPVKETPFLYYAKDGVLSLCGTTYGCTYVQYDKLDKITPINAEYYSYKGEPLFDSSKIFHATQMSDGITVATIDEWDAKNQKLNLVDKEGNIVLELKNYGENSELNKYRNKWQKPTENGYYYGTISSNIMARIGTCNYGLISFCSEYKYKPDDNINDIPDEKNDKLKWGYIDKTGKIVIPPIYDKVLDFSDTITIVSKDGSVIYIDTDGKEYELSGDYDSCGNFYNGYANVSKDGKYGKINKNLELVIPLEYDSLSDISHDYIIATKDNKYGYINIKNDVIIPFEYDKAYSGENGFFTVGLNDKYGIIDKNNKVVVPLEYDDISEINNGTVYAVKNQKVYLIKLSENHIDTLEIGDVNNDGHINAVDASSVLSYYAMISTNKDGDFNDAQQAAADVNHDGQINAVDASCILSYYAYVSTTKEDIKSLEDFLKQ